MKTLPITEPSPVTDALLERYRLVVPVQGMPKAWNRQDRHKGDWFNMETPLGDDDLRLMLAHGPWLACPARRDGTTDRIGFDLDCEGPFDVRRRDALYGTIRRLFGMHHEPLVYATPSGYGLRVYYAIPRTELAPLVSGRDAGLVADVLRAAAIPVRPGTLEIFPQATQVDRLPLGRRMPLLDPRTLRPIPEAALGDTFDAGLLEGGLALMERWLATPCTALVAHLESLPRATRRLVISPQQDDGVKEGFVRIASGLAPSLANRALVKRGLSGPSTRYHSEWSVGISMLIQPPLFEDLGLRDIRDDRQVAGTLARWVAERSNGHSREWADTLRRCRSTDVAIGMWEERFLERGSASGEHLVDRLRRAVAALDGSMRRTLLVSELERLELVSIAEAAGLTTSALFRTEVWLSSYLRAVKCVVNYRVRRDMPTPERVRDGKRTVVVPIAARWMEDWQFGKGRYRAYRRLLIGARHMRITRYSPSAAAFRAGAPPLGDLAHAANEYEVRMPEMDLLVRDVGVHYATLKLALAELQPTMSGRLLTMDTAHHIHWLYRSGLPLRRRYGSRLGRTIEAIGGQLDARLKTQGERILYAGAAVPATNPIVPAQQAA